jgi:hypothetical protein
MHIIFFILKLIGIILASILGLIVLLLLIVLLVPIRYRVNAEHEDDFHAEAKVSWLMRIIYLRLKFTDNHLVIVLRIFGRIFYHSDLAKDDGKTSDETEDSVNKSKLTRKKRHNKINKKSTKIEKTKIDEEDLTDKVKTNKDKINKEVITKKEISKKEITKKKITTQQETATQKETQTINDKKIIVQKETSSKEESKVIKDAIELKKEETKINKEEIETKIEENEIKIEETKARKEENEINIEETKARKEENEINIEETKARKEEIEIKNNESTVNNKLYETTLKTEDDHKKDIVPLLTNDSKSIKMNVQYEDEKSEDGQELKKSSGKKHKFYGKIKSFFIKIKETFIKLKNSIFNVNDKLHQLKEKWYKIKAFIKDEVNKAGISLTLKSLLNILKHIRPRKLQVELEIGTGDPCSTGQVLGALSVFYGYYGKSIQLIPNFNESVLKGTIFCIGRIRLLTLLIICIKLILDKKFKRLLNNFKVLKEEL